MLMCIGNVSNSFVETYNKKYFFHIDKFVGVANIVILGEKASISFSAKILA